MIGERTFKVLSPAGENKFGEKEKAFVDTGETIRMKLAFNYQEKVDNGIMYRKPSFNGHTFSKTLKQGQRLQSGSDLFEVDYVNNEPRLSVVYLVKLL